MNRDRWWTTNGATRAGPVMFVGTVVVLTAIAAAADAPLFALIVGVGCIVVVLVRRADADALQVPVPARARAGPGPGADVQMFAAARYTYDTLSRLTKAARTGNNPVTWSYEYDNYKIGERYYYPTLGRWTQRDPLMQVFSPREANGYTYVGGDPVNLLDPSGTCFGWDACEDAVSDASGWIEEQTGLSGEEQAGLVIDAGLSAASCIPAAALGPAGAAVCGMSSTLTVAKGYYDATDDNDSWYEAE